MIQNPQPPPDKTISGETFSEPYRPGPEVITNPEIFAVSKTFQITPAQYVYLTNTTSTWSEWAVRMMFVSAALLVPTLWKHILTFIRDRENVVGLTDYGATAMAFFAAIILWIIGKYRPNERARILKEMKDHFDNADTKIEVRKRS